MLVINKINASWITFVLLMGSAWPTHAELSLPSHELVFDGRIGPSVDESVPDYPVNPRPPADAPNVLVILTDDVGFGASSSFGGPISTPTLDALAAHGLRYNRFHVAPACSPTRASLLTGRQPHAVGFGAIENLAIGFPGYNSIIPRSAGTISEVLKQHGYNTAMFGKHHNTPSWEATAAGPFDRWPTGLGFEYFYGFLGGETDQWWPMLYQNTVPVDAPVDGDGYILDRDLADNAIGWLRQQNTVAPDKPFFVYYSTGTPHAPLQAPANWIAKFRGQFDQGWDAVRQETLDRQKRAGVIPAATMLTARPEQIPAWASLSTDEQRLYARFMEVYAATLAHADYQVGRVIEAIDAMGELDNTLIIYVQGDNGASSEGGMSGRINEMDNLAPPDERETLEYALSMMDEIGGPRTYPHYPVGWAHAMNTPFQWTKLIASHFGGIRTGMVVSWPRRIKDMGAIRPQFHFVADIMSTILEAVGVDMPSELNGVEQKPLDSVSMVYSFDLAQARSPRTTQYFESLANRAIYHDGWMAATTPVRAPWDLFRPDIPPDGIVNQPQHYPWELYHVDNDFSQAMNVATQHPDRLRELQTVFDVEARKHGVYPLDPRVMARIQGGNRPSIVTDRTKFSYFPGNQRIPTFAVPHLGTTSFAMTAHVDIPAGGADGVLATDGNRFGGWVFMVDGGKPAFIYAASNRVEHHFRVASPEKLEPGKHQIRLDFEARGNLYEGGTASLLVDGQQVAKGSIGWIPAVFPLGTTFNVGLAADVPIVDDYADRMPFRFTGVLEKLVVELPDSD